MRRSALCGTFPGLRCKQLARRALPATLVSWSPDFPRHLRDAAARPPGEVAFRGWGDRVQGWVRHGKADCADTTTLLTFRVTKIAISQTSIRQHSRGRSKQLVNLPVQDGSMQVDSFPLLGSCRRLLPPKRVQSKSLQTILALLLGSS